MHVFARQLLKHDSVVFEQLAKSDRVGEVEVGLGEVDRPQRRGADGEKAKVRRLPRHQQFVLGVSRQHELFDWAEEEEEKKTGENIYMDKKKYIY